MTETPPKSTVKTTETTLSVLHALQEMGAARIDDVAKELNVAPSTIHRHLVTLREHGYVVKEGEHYRLGLRFLTVAGTVLSQHPVYDLARQKVRQLAEETGERVQFIAEEGGYRTYIHTATGENAVQTDATLGKRGYLHVSAAGKAILAQLPESRVEEIISATGLPAETENTITDRERFLDELETVRERGVAFNYEESTAGLRAVAAAVTDADGSVVGALSVAGPAHRLKDERFTQELPDLILGVANEMELKLKYS